MQQRIASLQRRLCPPDILVEMPADRFSMFEFYRSAEIVEAGREAMRAALGRFAERASDGMEFVEA